eukprot:1287752-Ditylum_brightwellii.AAC.1
MIIHIHNEHKTNTDTEEHIGRKDDDSIESMSSLIDPKDHWSSDENSNDKKETQDEWVPMSKNEWALMGNNKER